MRNLLFLAGAFLALATAGFVIPGPAGTVWADSPASQVSANEQTQLFKVEKMTCAACPITVKKAIKRVDGVKSVSVDFDAKTAVVVFDPSITNVDEIAAASTDVGYPATPISP
jgi:periplasmic mercuric ion binding protein